MMSIKFTVYTAERAQEINNNLFKHLILKREKISTRGVYCTKKIKFKLFQGFFTVWKDIFQGLKTSFGTF